MRKAGTREKKIVFDAVQLAYTYTCSRSRYLPGLAYPNSCSWSMTTPAVV